MLAEHRASPKQLVVKGSIRNRRANPTDLPTEKNLNGNKKGWTEKTEFISFTRKNASHTLIDGNDSIF
jgi:hypothetical protein